MRDLRLRRDCTLIGGPGVEVRIEVNDGDRAIHGVQGTENGEYDGVVASEPAYMRNINDRKECKMVRLHVRDDAGM